MIRRNKHILVVSGGGDIDRIHRIMLSLLIMGSVDARDCITEMEAYQTKRAAWIFVITFLAHWFLTRLVAIAYDQLMPILIPIVPANRADVYVAVGILSSLSHSSTD